MSIVVFTIEDDQSTSDVIDWLLYKGEEVIRINDNHPIEIKEISFNEGHPSIIFEYCGLTLRTEDISAFWYRKGSLKLNEKIHTSYPQIQWYLTKEIDSVVGFFISQLDSKARINTIATSNMNKLVQLSMAANIGLNIPKTLLTKNKKSVKQFLVEKESIITKSIQAPFYFELGNNWHNLLTSTFTKEDLINTNTSFFMTKFQDQIEKQYELRIFFLRNKFYSMAIFSQSNEKTKIDFRDYDNFKPNRFVPFKLPQGIQSKLKLFMNKLKLNSGSIDIIVDKEGKYWFLEVNPVGQFGMVSNPCNYYIEEIVANSLRK